MYPPVFTEVMELFWYVRFVGLLREITSPYQVPVTVLLIVMPSLTSVNCPFEMQQVKIRSNAIDVIFVMSEAVCWLINS
jgi:hypothetical protein